MAVAFRCKACGHFEPAEHAGENHVPHACSVCGAGVALNPQTKTLAEELCKPDLPIERRLQIAGRLVDLARTGENQKHADPDNWEVLHNATDARLEELGLTRTDVCGHDRWTDEEGVERKPHTVKAGPVKGRSIAMNIAGTDHATGTNA